MSTSTQVSELKINSLTKAQYSTITPSNTELYLITDADTVQVLESSGSLSLMDSTIYSITPTGTVTFVLPAISSANNEFHQILIQINLTTVQTINLGLGATPHYFNNIAPNFSAVGVYNLLYEYDKANQYWIAGSVSKGVEE